MVIDVILIDKKSPFLILFFLRFMLFLAKKNTVNSLRVVLDPPLDGIQGLLLVTK